MSFEGDIAVSVKHTLRKMKWVGKMAKEKIKMKKNSGLYIESIYNPGKSNFPGVIHK
jgi:hypothetical protein